MSLGTAPLGRPSKLAEVLRRPEVSYAGLAAVFGLDRLPALLGERVETTIKYEGYLDRQEEEARRFRSMEETPLPPELDYQQIPGLSREITEKLSKARPQSLGQASRIPGVTPAAVSILMVMARTQRAS